MQSISPRGQHNINSNENRFNRYQSSIKKNQVGAILKTAIPTNRDPVLPQKKHGVLAFEPSEDLSSRFREELKNIG